MHFVKKCIVKYSYTYLLNSYQVKLAYKNDINLWHKIMTLNNDIKNRSNKYENK